MNKAKNSVHYITLYTLVPKCIVDTLCILGSGRGKKGCGGGRQGERVEGPQTIEV
jgi:hypothetical protein